VALVTLAGLAACLLPSWRAASVELPWPSAMSKIPKNHESNLKKIFRFTKLFPAYLRLYLWDAHRLPVVSPQKC